MSEPTNQDRARCPGNPLVAVTADTFRGDHPEARQRAHPQVALGDQINRAL